MNFLAWKREIERRSFACGGDIPAHREENADRVIAAAAAVIATKGEEWVLANPKVFQTEVLNKLGTWITVGFFILRIFGFANPFVLIASWILPVVANWLQEHVSLASKGLCAAMDWKQLGNEAELFVRTSHE